jgi:hypothetical protein
MSSREVDSKSQPLVISSRARGNIGSSLSTGDPHMDLVDTSKHSVDFIIN